MSSRPNAGAGRDEVEQVVAKVQASRKYRHLCPDTIRRIAADEVGKRGAFKAAVKSTQARLHQVYAAYERGIDYDRAYGDLRQAYAEGTRASVEEVCRHLFSLHASTDERLPVLDQFYEQVFALTGVPGSLLDLACGLNPLALPWMGLPEGATYDAYDIDRQRVDFLNRWFALAGVQGEAYLQDVICDPPTVHADVALCLKSVTCLERQRPGSALALIDGLQVRWVVVSFPVESLGHRDKGMPEHYAGVVGEWLSGRPWSVERLDLTRELVFVVDKG